MSFKPEVVADSSGTWAGNALRFATEDEAEMYVKDLARRWTLVTATRVVPSDDPVTDAIDLETGVMRRVESEVAP
jgi:hypothetical protein